MSQLDRLRQQCNAILLAEAVGWLHDYRKCSSEHLRVQAANLSKEQALPRSEANDPRRLSGRCPLEGGGAP
jgi:hypothetical protein